MSRLRLLGAGYAALIAYASLFPFDWKPQAVAELHLLKPDWALGFSRADVVANVLAYVPMGVLLAWSIRAGSRHVPIVFATACGAALSLLMELLQQFVPGRIPTVIDIAANTAGAFAGALLPDARKLGAPLMRWRDRWVGPGRLCDLGLGVLGLWALSQLVPLVPSLDMDNLRHGLAPVWHTLRQPERFEPARWTSYALGICGLALLARTMATPGRAMAPLFFAFVAVVLLGKVTVVGRQLTIEALAGAAAAAILAAAFGGLRRRAIACIGAVLVLTAFVCAELAFDRDGTRYPFNWVLFMGALENPVVGFNSILEGVWPAAALAYFVRTAAGPPRGARVQWIGGATLAITVFALEWYQQNLPGRYGDITMVVVFAGAWFLVWAIPATSDAPIRARAQAARSAAKALL